MAGVKRRGTSGEPPGVGTTERPKPWSVIVLLFSLYACFFKTSVHDAGQAGRLSYVWLRDEARESRSDFAHTTGSL